MDCMNIIVAFYPADTPLRRLLLLHSRQVREKALEILDYPANTSLDINRELVADGAMLHDIGIFQCHAPSILCNGLQPYLAHGIIGGAMLRSYGAEHGLELEAFARICERHTGSGLTAEEVRRDKLPIPERDYLPETLEEQLICLADKFYSKSSPEKEKSLASVRHSMDKFGFGPRERFNDLCRRFAIGD